MGTTQEEMRRLALALPETSERPSHGTPAFYVAGRIFARVREDPGVVVLWRRSVEDRDELIASEPDTFFTTDHYRGHASVLCRLGRLDADELAELLLEA